MRILSWPALYRYRKIQDIEATTVQNEEQLQLLATKPFVERAVAEVEAILNQLEELAKQQFSEKVGTVNDTKEFPGF